MFKDPSLMDGANKAHKLKKDIFSCLLMHLIQKSSKTLVNNIKINKNSQYINFVGNVIKKR